MARFYKKSECTFKSGYICDKDGNILDIGIDTICALNAFERKAQSAFWFYTQEEARPAADLDDFEFHSMFGGTFFRVHDQEGACDVELRAVAGAITDKMNDLNEGVLGEAFAFLAAQEFAASEGMPVKRLDLATFGPALMDVDQVQNIALNAMFAIACLELGIQRGLHYKMADYMQLVSEDQLENVLEQIAMMDQEDRD